jgi:Zn-dependent protease with chaperone function
MRLPRLKTSLAAAAVLASSASLGACAYNEALGRSQVLLVDEGQLAQAAASAWTQTLSRQRTSNDPVLNRRVRDVGTRLVQAAGVGGQNWEYRVFESDQPNAFVLPGGRVGVNTGLFKVVQNDDQLAAVLGHEIAHSTLRHAAERYSQTQLAQVGLGWRRAPQERTSPNVARAISTFGGAGAQLGYLLPVLAHARTRGGPDRRRLHGARPASGPSQAVQLWRNMAAQASRSGPRRSSCRRTPSDATRIQQLEPISPAGGYS